MPGLKSDSSLFSARVRAISSWFDKIHPAAWVRLALAGLAAAALAGCGSTAGNVAMGTGATTAIGGMIPENGIEQTYYLGIFDPRDQLKAPQFYRVRVRGQASILSRMNFQSGWVRADLIDSLSSSPIQISSDGSVSGVSATSTAGSSISMGRHLMLFGPEGFREAPTDHRLVIVMGASPEKFFSAIDESLGMIARATQQPAGGVDAKQKLMQELARINVDQARLDAMLIEMSGKGE